MRNARGSQNLRPAGEPAKVAGSSTRKLTRLEKGTKMPQISYAETGELTEAIVAWESLRRDVREREKIFEDSLAEDKLTVKLLEEDILSMLRESKLTSVKIEGVGTAYT